MTTLQGGERLVGRSTTTGISHSARSGNTCGRRDTDLEGQEFTARWLGGLVLAVSLIYAAQIAVFMFALEGKSMVTETVREFPTQP